MVLHTLNGEIDSTRERIRSVATDPRFNGRDDASRMIEGGDS